MRRCILLICFNCANGGFGLTNGGKMLPNCMVAIVNRQVQDDGQRKKCCYGAEVKDAWERNTIMM